MKEVPEVFALHKYDFKKIYIFIYLYWGSSEIGLVFLLKIHKVSLL